MVTFELLENQAYMRPFVRFLSAAKDTAKSYLLLDLRMIASKTERGLRSPHVTQTLAIRLACFRLCFHSMLHFDITSLNLQNPQLFNLSIIETDR
jgi:hypothetical protein